MTRVRAATLADYDTYTRLVGELGVDDPIPSRARFLEEIAERMLIAEDTAGVVGYALVEEMAGVGYIRNIVSDPTRRRTGVGVALMEAMRARFRAAGATLWCLNVKPANVAALALYERFGLRTAYPSTFLRLSVEVALPATPLALVPVPPERDAELEARFALLPGQLASARARPSRRVLQLVDSDMVLGVCVDMAMRGAFPFRLAAPVHAAAAITLLRALSPDSAVMQVGVEGDDALVAEVKRLGAVTFLELLHLRGAI